MNKFKAQEKRILLMLSGMVGTMILWAGGLGVSRMVEGLPTSSWLAIGCSFVGVFMISFVTSYAVSHVSEDE